MVVLIGTAQVQLQHLNFPHSRDKIPAAVEQLAALFQENCDPAAVQNPIPVYVRPGELQQILEQSHLDIRDVQRGLPPYPRLNPPSKIQAFHGSQRCEAALQCLGPQTWWVIRLYCVADSGIPESLLPDEINEFSQQTPYSDGEVFRQVYFHQQAGDWKRVNAWRIRLSKNKQNRLRKLLESGPICEKMYGLARYSGLCGGLELGNIHNLLAEHCVEEICNYLGHIRDTWDKITLQNPEVQQATDIATVQALERLAPSCGYIDRESVENLMDLGIIFSQISNPDLRQEIKQQLLNIGVVIPSIKTFHENMTYLKIGLRILRKHLLGRTRLIAGETVAQLMRSIWRPGTSLVEYAEDQFYQASSPSNFDMAYHIIFISALRNFPKLSTHRPNTEGGQETIGGEIDEQYLGKFLRYARALGFTSPAIECGLRQLPPNTMPTSPRPDSACNTPERNVKRRSGCPYTSSYSVISRHLFLPEMLKETEPSSYPSIIFIQTDFMRSFFHGFPYHLGAIARGALAGATRSRTTTPLHDEPPSGECPKPT